MVRFNLKGLIEVARKALASSASSGFDAARDFKRAARDERFARQARHETLLERFKKSK